jgi:pimeloyl-ACP methyl ester carboxylesterase
VPESVVRVGEVELCHETFGERDHPALLLVMGLATQMLGWHEDFCAELAARGFFVVRFDNRDVGRSTALDHLPAPTLLQLLRRDRRAAAYTIDDMAGDAVGLLDHLEIERAHVVGASMGGMIAQALAAQHPDEVRSLVSIMSNTGNRWRGQPALGVYRYLLKRAPDDREGFVEHMTKVFAAIGSPDAPADLERVRDMAARSWDRSRDPAAAGRQLGAIIASGNRTAELGRIKVPTLVIHGNKDRLVRPSGGRATARAIPGARLMVVDRMGHDLPERSWPQIIDAIADHAHAADRTPEVVGSGPDPGS